MKKILMLLPLSVIPLSLLFEGCSSSNKNREDSLCADSIAAVELETARLDSLRQDSIARREFTSPDLTFHDLHGDVKEVFDDAANETYKFDEKGTWTNTPTWSKEDRQLCPERTKRPRVERDREGYITRIWNECDCDYAYQDFTSKDGKLNQDKNTRFNDLGFLIYSAEEEGCGPDPAYAMVYYNYKVDGVGNWISRDVYIKTYCSDEEDAELIPPTFEKRTEKRKITYYKSDGGEAIPIADNPEQKKALASLKASEKKLKQNEKKKEESDKKGPEWINGIWEVNTTVSTAMGSFRVNAKVCIDRDSQQLVATDSGSTVARGIYRVSGNTIYCGDLYIDMDISNQRLEYGDGVYYRKVSDKYL